MAKTSDIAKSKKSQESPKFSSRIVNRCFRCGRRHAYIRDYKLCRICFREMATKGDLPGVKKASW